MSSDLSFLFDLSKYRVNQRDAHSDHIHYSSLSAFQKGDKDLWQSLDGEWNLFYSDSIKERNADFYKEESSLEGSFIVKVPGHVETQGFGQIQYINTMYPWEGHEMLRPPMVPEEFNSVSSYVRFFDLKSELRGKRIVIRFEGVEQAMYLYLNGQFVGYAEDSFTPSEFDLTPYIRDENNKLAVEVFKRSKAAYLEDQDFFRFSGIFRSVDLYALPAVHVEDMDAACFLTEDGKGEMKLTLKLSAEKEFSGSVSYELAGHGISMTDELPVSSSLTFPLCSIADVKPYEYSSPSLYQLLISVKDADGKVIEVVPYEIGFKRVEIIDKVMYLNGKRLIIQGVNRHEWSPYTGRAISKEEMEKDMEIIRSLSINSVRTCHYPDNIDWYYLCDKNGIYLMAETNLESHGSWQKMGSVEPSWNVPGDDPEWTKIVLDRARTNYETFKNHPSIIMWSLGNESYAGEAFAEMNAYFKSKDKNRLVHYEGVFHRPDFKERVSDVESHMYSSPDTIREYFKEDGRKPFVLCEYMHDMGNSLGGLDSYDALLDEYESYQGGWIWDYIDQALYVKDEVSGNLVLRYGGDFNEKCSDYEFSANGIVFADRSLKPACQEVRYFYARRVR